MEARVINFDKLIRSRVELAAISSKSHIVTVFGDVISQHGNWLWLGSLIESLEPLGFSERLIRTSVFRLVKDDWLQVIKNGRKSFYAFTDSANNHYTKAARRIYAGSGHSSGGQWLIVMPSFVCEDKLITLKRQLRWLGFSPLSSGAYAHPSIDQGSLEETISELELQKSVIIFSSQTLDASSDQALKRLVREKWNIEELQQRYQTLIDCYQTVLDMIEQGERISDQQCFLLRTLLIHEYRRILLKDHELPANMLPDNWAGFKANQLVKQLYAYIAKPSCRYIVSNLQAIEGFLPKVANGFRDRFK